LTPRRPPTTPAPLHRRAQGADPWQHRRQGARLQSVRLTTLQVRADLLFVRTQCTSTQYHRHPPAIARATPLTLILSRVSVPSCGCGCCSAPHRSDRRHRRRGRGRACRVARSFAIPAPRDAGARVCRDGHRRRPRRQRRHRQRQGDAPRTPSRGGVARVRAGRVGARRHRHRALQGARHAPREGAQRALLRARRGGPHAAWRSRALRAPFAARGLGGGGRRAEEVDAGRGANAEADPGRRAGAPRRSSGVPFFPDPRPPSAARHPPPLPLSARRRRDGASSASERSPPTSGIFFDAHRARLDSRLLSVQAPFRIPCGICQMCMHPDLFTPTAVARARGCIYSCRVAMMGDDRSDEWCKVCRKERHRPTAGLDSCKLRRDILHTGTPSASSPQTGELSRTRSFAVSTRLPSTVYTRSTVY
jgi:hypothetical protein